MKKIIITIVLNLLIVSCDSPLSEIAITQPGLIKPLINIKKSTFELGYRLDQITVQLKDSKNEDVELKGGAVIFKGMKLPYLNYLFGDSYYKLSSEDCGCTLLFPDSTYRIRIQLADSIEYFAEILMPEIDIKSLDVPSSHNKAVDMKISWSDTSYLFPQKIEFKYSYRINSTSEDSTIYMVIPDPISGWFLIDQEYFTIEDDIWQVEITVISETEGILDNRFLAGGYIKSRFSIKRKIQIE